MGYAQAFRLLVAGYKKIKGKMPEGLDLLKIKQEARKKVIDTNKVIKVNFDKANNWMKAKPQGLEKLIKKGDVKIGQAPKTTKRKPAVDPKLTQEENIKNIMAENKAAAKRLQEKMNKPEKSLGDKLKDYKGDPDAMREGGLLGYAVGGRIQNLRNAYQANPTLQNQFTEDQYLDLFDQTTTKPTTASTILQSQIQPEGITAAITPNIVRPLIIPGSESDGGPGITNINRNKNFDYETEAYGINPTGLSKDVFDYEFEAANEDEGILQTLLSMSPTLNTLKFVRDKGVAAKNRFDKFREDQRIKKEQAEQEAAQREFDRLNALRQIRDAESMSGGPGETTQGTFGSSVNDASTFSDYS